MENEHVVVPLEALSPMGMDVVEEKVIAPKPPKVKIDPDVYIKFVFSNKGVRVAKRVGVEKEYRIVPNDVDLSLVYPSQIKSSLWNSFPTWSKK